MSVSFGVQKGTEFHLVDPVDGELITSTRVPQFLQTHERYGPGLEYLQQNAGSIAVNLHLVRHVTAEDLGDDFEERLAAHNTLALEDNGWNHDIYDALNALSKGESLDDFLNRLDGLGYLYEQLRHNAADGSTFHGRLVRAIEGSNVDICIADIPHRYSGDYEEQVHALWRQSTKREFLPLLYEQAVALREWFMPASLGVQLLGHGRAEAKVLYPVGANHFLLQDKFMTLGIMTSVEMISGDGGLSDPNSSASRLFAIRNVGHVSMEGLDWHGRSARS